MAPFFERERHKDGSIKLSKRLFVGAQVILHDNKADLSRVTVGILDEDRATVHIEQRALGVSTGNLSAVSEIISFKETILPQVVTTVVEKQSICVYGRGTENRNGVRREIIWTPELEE